MKRPSRFPAYVNRDYWWSTFLMWAFYCTVLVLFVTLGRFGQRWAALGFFAFLLWAYRRVLGARFGLCARRPGALAEDALAEAREQG